MLNPGTETDESKYYALVLSIAAHAPSALQAKALGRLVDAVSAESKRRAACRDTDIKAATRVRAW